MTKRKGNILAPLLVLALIFPLAGIMIMREPQVAWMFILAAAILPIAWILIEVFKAPKSNDEAAIEDRATLRNSIFTAGLLIILPLGLTVVFSSGIQWITDAMEIRIMGASFGIALIIIANAIPKRPVSMSGDMAERSRRQAFSRFAGRILMITGGLYAIAAFIVPEDYAAIALTSIVAIGSGSVFIRAIANSMRSKAEA